MDSRRHIRLVVVPYVHLGRIIGQVTTLAVIKSLGVILPYGAGQANKHDRITSPFDEHWDVQICHFVIHGVQSRRH